MSDHTLRSLFDLISGNRRAREENTRTMNRASPVERPWWNMQMAVFDQDFRSQLDAIDELPDLLVLAPRLQDGWPYPPEDALQVFRAELAQGTRKPIQEIDELPLREVVALLGGRPAQRNGAQEAPLPVRREVSGADVTALPRWARVAFAARCARRVERLLGDLASHAPPDELEGVERAVRLAEQSAAAGATVPETDTTATAVMEQAHRVRADRQLPAGQHGVTATTLIELLRGTVGSAAATAARAAAEDNPHLAFDAYQMASQAAHALSSSTVLGGMRRDFAHLEALARKEEWTDQTAVTPAQIPHPRLKLVGLHVRDLRAVRQFDLPQDGLGWQEQMPDLILLGGINGSGKTTLLNFLTDCLSLLTRPPGENFDVVLPKWLAAREAWAEFELESYELPCTHLRFVVGDEAFVEANKTDNCWWITRMRNGGGFHGRKGNTLHRLTNTIEQWFRQVTIPSVVFLPSEDRTLIVPGADYKAAGKLADDQQFVYRWRPPAAWKDSLEALLYSLRWEDLNAKEEGHFTDLSHFSAYADAFRRFTGDAKSLRFEEGKLVVKLANSTVAHDLADLSSGERQVLLLSAELLRYWRPGSLILIDEPELHLHTRWQTQLYEALRYWQKERGGQVILATQSAHLAELAGAGTAALLGVEPL